MNATTKSVIALGAGLLVGGAVGYMVANKRAEAKYAAIADEEIAAVKQRYKLLRKEGEYADPREALKAFNSIVDEFEYSPSNEEVESYKEDLAKGDSFWDDPSKPKEPKKETTIVKNVFDNQEEFQKAVGELDDPQFWNREGLDKFVITQDEFHEDWEDYAKLELIYYEYDNTLTDSADSVVEDIEGIIGEKSLLHFGKGSTDKDTLYVRNTNMEADYEIIRKEGAFAEAVYGTAPDETHAPYREARKMRGDDE